MKTFEITKEQILELANESSFTKATLNKMFPQAFESELEVGKWYKTKNGHLKFFVDEGTAYGFDMIGNWNEVGKGYRYSFRSDNYWTPATDKEVETALIAEAKRKYTLGCKIKKLDNFYYGSSNLIIDDLTKIQYEKASNQLAIKDKKGFWICIFKNGKWAEIISEPIELTLEQRIERIEEQLKIKK